MYESRVSVWGKTAPRTAQKSSSVSATWKAEIHEQCQALLSLSQDPCPWVGGRQGRLQPPAALSFAGRWEPRPILLPKQPRGADTSMEGGPTLQGPWVILGHCWPAELAGRDGAEQGAQASCLQLQEPLRHPTRQPDLTCSQRVSRKPLGPPGGSKLKYSLPKSQHKERN